MADSKQSRSQARDAGGERTDQQVDRTERGENEGESQFAPRATTRPRSQEPGPDVSNADIDLNSVSLDSGHSEHMPNPDPNPNDLRPAPGPSVVEVLGQATEDPVENKFEGTRR